MAKTKKENKLSDDQRIIAVLSHILMLFGGFIPPLIIFLMTNKKKGFAYENAKNALNFSLSLSVYFLISALLILIIVGIVLIFALIVFSSIIVVIGAIKASEGNIYKYPMTINFLK